MRKSGEIMLIGGASLYEQWLPYAHQMYITLINGEFDGDAWFPDYQADTWQTVWREAHQSEKEPFLKYQFLKLKKTA